MNTEKLKSLLESTEGLTDEFKQSVEPIFEEALQSAVAEKDEQIQALREELASVKESKDFELGVLNDSLDELVKEGVQEEAEKINEKINKYLFYVVEEFVKSHESALIATESAKLSESFLKDVGSLFAKYNIEEPVISEDVSEIEALRAEITEAYDTIYNLTEQRCELEQKISGFERENVLATIAEEKDLTSSQMIRLESLVSDFEGTTEDYKAKVELVAEQLCLEDTVDEKVQSVVSSVTPITEDVEVKRSSGNDEVDAIAESLVRFNRK